MAGVTGEDWAFEYAQMRQTIREEEEGKPDGDIRAEVRFSADEILGEVDDHDRAVDDLTMLVKSDPRWSYVLDIINLPGGYDILRSFKNQLIEWLDQLPGQRRYPESPLSTKQIQVAYTWKTGKGADASIWKRKNSIRNRTMG